MTGGRGDRSVGVRQRQVSGRGGGSRLLAHKASLITLEQSSIGRGLTKKVKAATDAHAYCRPCRRRRSSYRRRSYLDAGPVLRTVSRDQKTEGTPRRPHSATRFLLSLDPTSLQREMHTTPYIRHTLNPPSTDTLTPINPVINPSMSNVVNRMNPLRLQAHHIKT